MQINIGSTALDVAKWLFEYCQIDYMAFNIYKLSTNPHFSDREMNQKYLSRQAEEALLHISDSEEEKIQITHRSGFDQLRDDIDSRFYYDDSRAIKLLSKVRSSGKVLHIPMLDFDLDKSDKSIDHVEESIRCLGITKGAIFEGTNSYHAWGFDLSSTREWRRLLTKALLLDDVDHRWIGHRMLNNQSALRVSQKRNHVPFVVRVL